ncbi:MAG: ATP-binding protein [Nanoarchaeota archaeon]|nr:ATP-binding protein [Nanoarchaeota archaeon]
MDKSKIEGLIIEAKNFFDFYKKNIGESIRRGVSVIELDFSHLTEFSNSLSDQILISPEETLRLMEIALEESGLVNNVRIRLTNLPEVHLIRIRNIRSRNLNELIMVEGIVRQASDVRPQVVNAKFECPSCGTVLSVLQMEKKFHEPSRCSCGRKGGFKLLSKEMVDTQRIVIEESPDSLIGGEQPKRMNVFLKEDLVEPRMEEKTTPGSRVRVIGILKEVPVPLKTGGLSTRFEIAVEANNLIPLEETFEELKITEEDERQILELSNDPQIFEKLARSICPSIYGYEEIKKSLVLQLFGGVRKTHPDGSKSRGDIHILLVGDPGVAKSIGGGGRVFYYNNEELGYEAIEKIFEKFGERPKNLKTLTIDTKTHKPIWAKIDKIIKHLPEKELIKITTEHGKQIIATKDHSFITLSVEGEIIPIKGEELTEKSYLPLPINFHKQTINEIKTEKFNTYKTNSKQLPDSIKLDKNFGFFIGAFLSEGNIRAGKSIIISNKNSKIKSKVKEFSKIIGLNTNENKTTIIINSKSLANLIKFYCYDKGDIKTKVKGNYSRIKKIPEFSYFAPKEFIKGLISGIFSGDGRFAKDKKRIKGVELITVSKKLAEGTSDLLFSIGILNKIKKSHYKYKEKATFYYKVYIPSPMIKKFRKSFNFYGREFLKYPKPIYSYNNEIPCGELVYSLTKKLGYNKRIGGDRTFAAEMRTVRKRNKIGRIRLRKIIKLFERKTKENLKELKILKKIAYSPIIWSKIETIEEIEEKEQYVYDLSIPRTNTFVANGIGVHNSVTLVFMAAISPKGRYVVGKSASLEYNEPLLIMEEGKQKFVKIGEFVDRFYSEKKGGFVSCDKEIKALSLNLETKKLEWKPIKAVFRHKNQGNLISFSFETGRKIKITKDHSIFSIEDGKIICKPAQELKEGDFAVIPKIIPTTQRELSEDIAKFLGYFIAEGHLYNKEGSYKIEFTLNKKEMHIASEINCFSEKFFKKEAKISKHGENAIRVTIYGKDPYLQMCSWLGEIAHKRAGFKGVPELILNSNPLARQSFFSSYIEGDAGVSKSGKLISEIMYMNLQDKIISSCIERKINRIALLQDGRKINCKGYRYDLLSPNRNKKFKNIRLNFPIACLSDNLKKFFKRKIKQGYNRINIDRIDNNMLYCRLFFVNNKNKINGKELRKVFGKNALEYFSEHNDLFLKQKKSREVEFSLTEKGKKVCEEIEELKEILESDVAFIKIKKIEEVISDKEWVYDISVPDCENFIAGFGGVLCHNSGAGITATVVRDEFLRGWSLEAGAMVLSNKGLVCIDELEKMDPVERSAMHEAMEQQTVTISKANVQATLRAETSVLAAANPKFGRFDPFQPIPQQIDIPPTLINRFDVIFTLRDIPNKEKDEAIADHVLHEHQQKGEEMIISKEFFRKYVGYAKQKIHPLLSDEAVGEIKKFYVNLRNTPVSSESVMRPIPISARQLGALIRMSEASAKIKLSSVVTREDALKSIELMKYYLMQVGYDAESKTFDIDKITTGIATSQRNKIILVRETIFRLENRLGKLIPVEEVEKELEGKLDKSEIEESINKLNISGDVFKPRRGFVQRT